jgi:hypothetical protein
MTFKVAYDEENDCVIGILEGRLDMESAREYMAEASRVLGAHDCKRFLNDLRGAETNLSVLDTYDLPTVLKEIGAEAGVELQRWRRAIVAPKEASDTARFFETVAVNRGDDVKVFAEIDEAMAWLKGQK